MFCRAKIEEGNFHYALALGSYLNKDVDANLSPNCTDGKTRVCQYEVTGTLRRAIGTEVTEAFYRGELVLAISVLAALFVGIIEIACITYSSYI